MRSVASHIDRGKRLEQGAAWPGLPETQRLYFSAITAKRPKPTGVWWENISWDYYSAVARAPDAGTSGRFDRKPEPMVGVSSSRLDRSYLT